MRASGVALAGLLLLLAASAQQVAGAPSGGNGGGRETEWCAEQRRKCEDKCRHMKMDFHCVDENGAGG